MPPIIIPALIAAIGVGIAIGIEAAIIIFFTSVVLGLVSQALTPDIEDFFPGGLDRKRNVTQPITFKTVIYGEARVLGPIVFLDTTNNNDILHLIIPVAGHEVEAIGDVFLNGDLVPLDPVGNAIGKYAGHFRLKKHLGGAGQVADPDLINESELWTENHVGVGIAYVYARLKFNSALFSSIPPVACIVKGKKIFDPRDSGTRWTRNPSLIRRDYLTNTIHGLSVPTSFIDDATVIEAANIDDESVVVEPGADDFEPFAETVTSKFILFRAPNIIRSTLHLFNRFSVGAKLSITDPTGINTGIRTVASVSGTQITFVEQTIITVPTPAIDKTITEDFSAGVSTEKLSRATLNALWSTGDTVQLTTTDTLPVPLAIATDYFIINERSTLDLETLVTVFRLATTRANAFADTGITITTVGTGIHTVTRTEDSRYTLDGFFSMGDTHQSILNKMNTSCFGKLIYSGGTWRIHSGAFRSPTVSLDESDLTGPLEVQTLLSTSDLANSISGTFINPFDDWQIKDFPPLVSSAFITEDLGQKYNKEIRLPYTTSATKAQRLAKILLLTLRQQISVKAPFKLTAFDTIAGDVIQLSNSRLGWVDKEFEIQDWQFVTSNDADLIELGISMILRETSSTVFDFTFSEETILDPAPNTNLPNPFIIEEPRDLILKSGTAQLYLRLDGTIMSRIRVEWTPLADSFVTEAGRIEIQFKPTVDATWQKAGFVNGSDSFAFILDVEDGISYDVRIRSSNHLGSKSEWVIGAGIVVDSGTSQSGATNNTIVLAPTASSVDGTFAGNQVVLADDRTAVINNYVGAPRTATVDKDWPINTQPSPEDFTDATWTPQRSSVTANLAVASDGTLTADKLVEDNTAGSNHNIQDTHSRSAAVETWTTSLEAKAAERTQIRIYIAGVSTADSARATFNLIDGTVPVTSDVGGMTLVSATIKKLNDDWWLCNLTGTTDGVITSIQTRIFLTASGSEVYDGDGVSGAYITKSHLRLAANTGNYVNGGTAAVLLPDAASYEILSSSHIVVGKTAVPANVTGFSAQQNGNVVTFLWNQVAETDLSGYIIKFSLQGTFDWGSATLITEITKGTLVTNAAVPPGVWTLGIKAIDTSGNESTTATTFDLTVTNNNDVVFTLDEHPRWLGLGGGASTGFVRHDVSGRIVPDSTLLASAQGFETFDIFVESPVAESIYEGVTHDLGFDAPEIRAWLNLVAALGPGEITALVPIVQEFDYRLDAEAFDGFEPWTIGTVSFRFGKFKITLDNTGGVAYVDEFTPTFDTIERTEKDENVTVAVAGTAIVFADQFNLIPNIQATIVGGSALFPITSSVTTTGFTVTVFNTSGTDVGGTINWLATGV